MFPMAGPGDLSRMTVHLRETVLMMHWPWLQAPSVLNKHTLTYTFENPFTQVVTGEADDICFLDAF